MADIFLTEDVKKLLHNKFLVVIGDSVMRGVYKDIVLMLQLNEFLSQAMLRRKGEHSHCNDQLMDISEMSNKKSYREVRQYQTGYHLVRFYFVTACYNSYTEAVLQDLEKEPHPDVIIMNSCLWDVSRYGPRSMKVYQEHLCKLFDRLSEILKPDCLFVWSTAMPIAKTVRGGVLVPEIEFRQDVLRLDVIEGNFYAKQAVVEAGYDVLDLHYYFRHHVHLRALDGIHWNCKAHRRMSNLLFTHICEAWSITLPGRRPVELVTCDGNELFQPNGEPPRRLMQTMFQPPAAEEQYRGLTGPSIQYNRDYTYGSAVNHQRSASCDPSYLNNNTNMVQYGIGLVATNLLFLQASQMYQQTEQGNHWGNGQSGPQRQHKQGTVARYHPYHSRVNYYPSH